MEKKLKTISNKTQRVEKKSWIQTQLMSGGETFVSHLHHFLLSVTENTTFHITQRYNGR